MPKNEPHSEGAKPCSKCKEVKPLHEYHRDAKLKSGRASQCKSCRGVTTPEIERKRRKEALELTSVLSHFFEDNPCFSCETTDGTGLYHKGQRLTIPNQGTLQQVCTKVEVLCDTCAAQVATLRRRIRARRWEAHATTAVRVAIVKASVEHRRSRNHKLDRKLDELKDEVFSTGHELSRKPMNGYDRLMHDTHVEAFEDDVLLSDLDRVYEQYPTISETAHIRNIQTEQFVDWDDENDKIVQRIARGDFLP